jgi:TIR domain/VHL beta domain
MFSLSMLPEINGFFSYSREDDEAAKGNLTALRDSIQRELGSQLGRSRKDFRLFQDKEAIPAGTLWESQIMSGVERSIFFIPIITPRAVNSKSCHFEFELFLACEKALNRDDLVFPIYYIGVPGLDDEQQWRDHPVLNVVGTRQYVDWQHLRLLDIGSTEVKKEVERFCRNIVAALRAPHSGQVEAGSRQAAVRKRVEELRRSQKTQTAVPKEREQHSEEPESQPIYPYPRTTHRLRFVTIALVSALILIGSVGVLFWVSKPTPAPSTPTTQRPSSMERAEAIPCSEEKKLRSLATTTAASIVFLNKSGYIKRLYWLNHDGERVFYYTLESSQSVHQQTLIGHPWVVTNNDGLCESIYLPTPNIREVVLF